LLVINYNNAISIKLFPQIIEKMFRVKDMTGVLPHS